jgi:tetratricopeptide (TPR) repeat protein
LAIRRYIAVLVFLLTIPVLSSAQGNEEDMRTRAEDLFKQEKFEEALPLYSQLLALKLESSEYNYRFGACQLFTSQNKEEGIKYLNFASKDPTAPSLAHFYYGLGLQLNYQFEKAVVKYEKYFCYSAKGSSPN